MFKYISETTQVLRFQRTGFGKQSIIYPAAFCVGLGAGVVALGLTFYSKDVLGFDTYVVGLLAGTWPLAYAFSCLLIRPLFARVLPRYLMIASSFMMFLAVSFMVSATTGGMLFAFFALFGAAMGMFWSPLMGWLSVDIEGARLNRLISRFNLSWGIGAIVSPYLCGWLYHLSPVLPLRAGASLFLFVAAFVGGAALVLPRIKGDHNSGASDTADDSRKDESTPLRFVAWVGLWANHFGMGLLSAVFPLAARADIGMSETQVGLSYLFLNLVNVGAFMILGRAAFWHFRLWPMLASTGVRVLFFGAIAMAASVASVGLMMALLGTAISVAYSASIFHGCSGSINRARRMAIHEAVLASSLVVGAIVGGMLYQRFSAGIAYATCGGVNAVALGIQAWMGMRLIRRDPVVPVTPAPSEEKERS